MKILKIKPKKKKKSEMTEPEFKSRYADDKEKKPTKKKLKKKEVRANRKRKSR